MPSGTHGRSPFGGGSLGSSRGPSSSPHTGLSSRRRYFNGNRVFIFGHRSYVLTPTRKPLVTFLNVITWILFFIGLFSGLGIMGLNSEVKSARDDYYYYQQMITLAEKDSANLIIKAEVTDIQYDDDSEKYYLIYKVKEDSFPYTVLLKGVSYPVYDITQARDRYHKEIDIAVDSSIIDETTDSVPVEFKSTGLDEVYEYTSAKSGKRIATIVCIISSGLFAFSIISYLIIFKKSLTEIDETKTFETGTNNVPVDNNPTSWKCKYCGTTNGTDSSKCKSCGASKN